MRGTSKFYLIYLTLHYVARFVESNSLDLPRYPCDQTLEPRRALVLVYSQTPRITMEEGQMSSNFKNDIFVSRRHIFQPRKLLDSLNFLSLIDASMEIPPIPIKTLDGEDTEAQRECRKFN